MQRLKLLRPLVGAAVWILGLWFVHSAWSTHAKTIGAYQPVKTINAWVFDDHLEIELPFRMPWRWKPTRGDVVRATVFLDDTRTLFEVRPIGEVVRSRVDEHGIQLVTVHIFPHARKLITSHTTFRANTGPENFEQVVKTLMSGSHSKEHFERQWARFLRYNRQRLEDRFRPIIDAALTDYVTLIGPDIEAAIGRHQGEFNAIVKAYWEGTVKDRLMPMVEEKAMPEVNEHIGPILRDCGQELWDHAPAGSFVWNAFRDKMVPWDSKTNLAERFDKWLGEEGRPIIDKYIPRILAEAEKIGVQLANDPDISRITQQMISDILADPRLSALVQKVIQEAILDNPRTAAFLKQRWESDDLQSALRWVGNLVEPYATTVVDSFLLAEDGVHINPNLVTVLRAQILWKSDFWIFAETPLAHTGDPSVEDGHRFALSSTSTTNN